MTEFLREFWQYARQRKKYWMLPLVLVMILIAVLLFSAQSVVSSPFIYSFF